MGKTRIKFSYFKDTYVQSLLFSTKALWIEEHAKRNVIPFSEALEKTGFGIYNYILIFIGGFVYTVPMIETASVSYIVLVADCDLKLTNTDKGVLSAIGYIGIIASSHLWGFLADTKGRRAVIMPTLMISFFMSLVSSFSLNFSMLVFFRFLNGFFISGSSATIYAYIGEFHIDRTRSRVLLGSSFVYSIGAMVLPVCAWGVINQSWSLAMPFLGIVYRPWRLFAVLCGVPAFLCGLAVFFYSESPKFLLSIGKEKEAIDVLKRMHKWNGGQGELEIDGILPDMDIIIRCPEELSHDNKRFAVTFLKNIWNQTKLLFQGDLLLPTCITCTLHFCLYVTYFGLFMWYPYIIDTMVQFIKYNPGKESRICDIVYANKVEISSRNDTLHCTKQMEEYTFVYSLTLEVLYSVGYIILGIIIHRVRKAHILFVGFVASGLCGVISIYIWNPSIAIVMFIILFLSGGISPVVAGVTAEMYPTHLRCKFVRRTQSFTLFFKCLLVFPKEGVQVEKLPRENAIPFSDALEKAGFGIFNYFLIFIAGFVLSNVLLETSSISFILPVAECDLKLTNIDKGILSGIGYVGIIVSSYLWGFLADTKGRRAIIIPTLITSFVVTLISSFSHSFWMLVLLRFVNGFFLPGGAATMYAYLGEFHVDRNRSRSIMASSFIFSIGAMILPIFAWGVINHSWSLPIPFLGIVYKPWRLLIVLCGIPGVVCGLALLLYPESPRFLLAIGEEKKAIQVLKQMHKWNSGHGELKIDGIIPEKGIAMHSLNSLKNTKFLITLLRTMWKQTVPLFQGDFLRSTAIICMLQFWMYITYRGMYVWFPYITDSMVQFIHENPGNKSLICDVVYAKQIDAYKEDGHCTEKLEDFTYIYSLITELLGGIGYVIMGLIVNKVRKGVILFVVFVAFGACGPIAIHIDNPSVALAMYVLIFISGTGSAVLGGATVDLYPTHLRGMAICMSLMFARLGGVVGANIVGLLLADNCEMTFYISGFALIVCGFLALFIPQELKLKDDTEA